MAGRLQLAKEAWCGHHSPMGALRFGGPTNSRRTLIKQGQVKAERPKGAASDSDDASSFRNQRARRFERLDRRVTMSSMLPHVRGEPGRPCIG